MSAPAYAPQMAQLLLDLMPEGTATRQVVDAVDGVLDSGSVVVEVGCGYGRILSGLAARGHRCLGLEQVPLLADHARDDAAARGLSVEVCSGDAIDLLGLPAAPADAILIVGGTLTLFDPASRIRLLAACADRLRPGGLLFLDLHDADEVRRAHRGGSATRTFATRRGPVTARCTLHADVWVSDYLDGDDQVCGSETHYLLEPEALLRLAADTGFATRTRRRGWAPPGHIDRATPVDAPAGSPRRSPGAAHVLVLERSAS